MSIEMTVSEIAEVLGLSRQAINNRVKELPEEDTTKNDKGVTVVTRSGLIKLEEIYKKELSLKMNRLVMKLSNENSWKFLLMKRTLKLFVFMSN